MNGMTNISSRMAGSAAASRSRLSHGKDPKEEQKYRRQDLAAILGMEKFGPSPGTLEIKSREHRGDHILYDMTLETEPGVIMPFFMLTPPDAGSPEIPGALRGRPAVIVPHGHGSDGRYGPAGICRHEKLEENLKRFNHDIGLQFVRRGYTVFCPDARGSGDRRNPKEQGSDIDSLLSSSCTDLNNAFSSLGTCLTAAWCRDLSALTDLIIVQGWGEPGRLGVCGFSGGGLQALFFSALDRRISCTGVSGYFFKFEDCLLDSNYCSCNFIPSFPLSFDMADLGSLIAPDALIVERALSDPLSGRRGISGPRELAEDVKETYRFLDHEDMFVFSEVEGTHHFSGRDIFPFFDRHMGI